MVIRFWLSLDDNHKFMDSFLVLKHHIKALFQCSQYAAASTRIRQEVVGIGEQELIARHGSALHDVVHRQAVGQLSWAVNLHPVVKDENTDGSLPIERTVYQWLQLLYKPVILRIK